MRYALWLLLTATCFAQIQGNAPSLVDCAQDSTPIYVSRGVITWPENIALNDIIVLGFVTQNDGSTFSLADTLGNTWTLTSVTTTPPPQTGSNIWMAYTRSGFAGADTVTLTETSGSGFYFMVGCRYKGYNGVDGSVATATAAGSTSPTTISTVNTTTVNNDVCVSITGVAPFGSTNLSSNNTTAMNSEGTATPPIRIMMTTLYSGLKGSITSTNNAWGGVSTFAQQTLCFKPTTTIALVDTTMPDAGIGVAYSAQLHAIGGTATTLTYACTGLPANGLSLNTSTGVISGSNPTTGTVSIGCTVTDGTNTSATDNLTITVGVLRSLTIRQINNAWSGDAGTATTINALSCGDILVWIARGDDTHGGQGWVQATNGTNNKVTDTFNSPVRRLELSISGNSSWPFVAYVLGPITQSGNDTVNIINNQSSSSGRPTNMIWDISGGNVVDDDAAIAQYMFNTTSGSWNTSYTTLVPNVLLLFGADSPAGLTSMSVSAPFATDSIGGDVQGQTLYGHASAATAQTVTATTSYTGGAGAGSQQTYDSVMIPVRPTIQPATCPITTGPGEKIRRQVF